MVKSVFKDVESPLKFLTSDGIPNAFFKNNKIVAEGSKFDGMIANEKNINEAFDFQDYDLGNNDLSMGDSGEQELYRAMIEVFKGNISGEEARRIMEAAQGEFPLDFIEREKRKFMPQQPMNPINIPDGRSFNPNMNRNEQMNMMNPMPRATNPNNVDPRSVMKPMSNNTNRIDANQGSLLKLATMNKLGLIS